ncbi:ABC transporter ATP-binding protein [Marinitoga sp. 1155]|uniref:ABC transporter ATP-binding protein n=1 Tax=Marinitoga sp. 1155 TaxID=1428448 RepID=UPI0006413CE8|nr:ATP-binding cassette domain-containing protein [Marinitoga sp. 1155]KLO23164.1 ABC transporter [Marinitoga sp. 1155]
MVELKEITVIYNHNQVNEKIALKNLNLKIEKGDFISIIGSNGAGKSTLFKVLSGTIKPFSGEYFLDGESMNKISSHLLAKRISIVYQNPEMGVFPDLTIKENLILGSKKGFRGLKFGKMPSLDLLKSLNMKLENRLNTKVRELSGGQKQALALILAVLSNPKILLLDEHTAALDPDSTEIIMNLTKQINEKLGITILMITHDLNIAQKFGQKVLKMEEGKLVEKILNVA